MVFGGKIFSYFLLNYLLFRCLFDFLPFPPLVPLLATTTSRRSCSSYQMSLLLLSVDPGTRLTRTAEPSVVGPSSHPLDLVRV